MTDTTDPQTDRDEADVDTVASRAAQVITRMGADIRALTGERDRYRSAWCSARERAQAYGEGILRVVKDRESYQEWLRQAEERAASAPSSLTDKLQRARDMHRETCPLARGGVSSPAFRCGMCEVIDAPAVLPPGADRGAAERLSRVLEWVTGEVVSAKTEFGDGYRAAQRDIRDLIKGRFDYDPRPTTPPAVVAEPGKENSRG